MYFIWPPVLTDLVSCVTGVYGQKILLKNKSSLSFTHEMIRRLFPPISWNLKLQAWFLLYCKPKNEEEKLSGIFRGLKKYHNVKIFQLKAQVTQFYFEYSSHLFSHQIG